MADLSALKSQLGIDTNTPTKVPLEHPVTREPLVEKDTGELAHVLVVGPNSSAFNKAQKANQNRRLRLKPQQINADLLETEAVELLASCTTGWFLVNFEGEPVDFPYTAENARALYRDDSLTWIRNQVDRFLGDEGNFMKR